MDSNGPAGRLRGTPQQILDRYSALARDAASAGDMVLAENLWQHAEHYGRMLNAAQPQQQQQGSANGHRYGNGRDDDFDPDDQDETASQSESSRDKAAEAPAASANAEPPAQAADPAEAEQPATPPVWSEADVQAATDEAGSGSETRPRRRRRTRLPRQTDEGDKGSGENGSAASAASTGDDTAEGGATLKLPENPSPSALVDLLTRVEESDSRKARVGENGDD